MKILDIKSILSNHNVKRILVYIVLGVFFLLLFAGKTSYKIQAIAVSLNEEYIAYHEHAGSELYCYSADGTLQFRLDVPTDIHAGGNCALWFDGDTLFAIFYRTKTRLSVSMDGTVLDTARNVQGTYPAEFPGFAESNHRHCYNGNKIDVVYDHESFLGYWFLGESRRLIIIPKGTDEIIIWSATA